MEATSKLNRLVSPIELGDMLGVKVQTIRRWAKAGDIPSLRLCGRLLRFDIDEVEKALRQKATCTAKGAKDERSN